MQKKSAYNVCVVGVGAVGIELLRVLKQRKFPVATLTVLARSARMIDVDGTSYQVQAIAPEAFKGQEIVLFAGTEGEKGAAVTYAQEAIRQGAICIDNGADFRMDPEVPLVVPEVNPEDIRLHKGLIANPNCSTIQMVVALAPLHRTAKIKRVIVSTYQAASGAGRQAIEELKDQSEAALQGKPSPTPQALPRRIAFNAVPQIGPFQEMGYTSEEWKMVKETQKIMHEPNLRVTATTVRIPVVNGHSESVYVELEKPVSPEQAAQLWKKIPGVVVAEKQDHYPMPLDANGRDEVFIGRIRCDPFDPHALTFWVVADNLRKGAATNAVQIAELLAHS